MLAQADAGILTSLQLFDYAFDWIPLGSWICKLTLKVKDWSLCLLQVYASNAMSEYQAFVDDLNDALRRVGATESTILLGYFNAHIGTDNETLKDVIARHGDPEFKTKGRYLLQLCYCNEICIMITFFSTQKCLQVYTI